MREYFKVIFLNYQVHLDLGCLSNPSDQKVIILIFSYYFCFMNVHHFLLIILSLFHQFLTYNQEFYHPIIYPFVRKINDLK